MNKSVVLTIFAFLFLGVVFTAINLKSAFKIIPINSKEEVTVAPYSEWMEFVPESKKFKVLFPAYPQNAKESVTIPNTDKKRRYDMFVSQKLNNTIFMISQITYPADYNASDIQGQLHEIVEELVRGNVGNTLKSIEDTTFLNYPALDFQITNKEYSVAGKCFMKDKTIYLFTYIARHSDYNLEEYHYFIDSFKLTDK
jgi:hypothetical protein